MKYLIFFMAITVSAFAFEKNQEVITAKKELIKQFSSGLPSDKDAQIAVKDYFLELENLKIEINENARKWQRWIPKQNKVDFCQAIFIPANLWEELNSKCSLNGYFVCAQGLKTYRTWLEDFYKSMDTETAKYLQETKECKVF